MIADQAVILCGGRGERLRPLTDTLPKPMAPICGRPFLAHLLDQLRENGIREVVLLTGYLGSLIQQHFGDGAGFGLRIVYSHGPEEWETGRRLWEARALLHETFWLLYGDNYATFQPSRVEFIFEKHARTGCLSLHKRTDRANIAVADDGAITSYDSSRRALGLNAVEIGYALFSSRVFEAFEKPDCSFSQVLERLGASGELCGHVVRDTYYSISDPDRLRIMKQYLTPKKILLIDRDGTINEKAPRGEYVTDWKSFHFIPTTVEAMKRLAALGWSFIVISNQAGVARGMLAEEQVMEIDRLMVASLADRGIKILRSYYCFHHWDANCECRKPRPGLLLQASRDFLLPLPGTWYIGDDPRDCTASWEAGCKAAYLGRVFDLKDLPIEQRPSLISQDMSGMITALTSP